MAAMSIIARIDDSLVSPWAGRTVADRLVVVMVFGAKVGMLAFTLPH
jgi:hypothetical protein